LLSFIVVPILAVVMSVASISLIYYLRKNMPRLLPKSISDSVTKTNEA